MESLRWVDSTYIQKHQSDDPQTLRTMYYPNLVKYPLKGKAGGPKRVHQAVVQFLARYSRRVAILLGIYLLSLLPVVGRFVMPAASFYTFRKSVGTVPAAVIFGTGLVLPKRFIVRFMHSYYASRSLMRELVSDLFFSPICSARDCFFFLSRAYGAGQLEPYFTRIKFTPDQKRRWFKDREGVLFGFAFSFTVVLKTPFIGVLTYGIAQASTTYLITKITDPPPPPDAASGDFAESQTTWKNKHDFLQLSLDNLDKLNVPAAAARQAASPLPRKRFS